MESRLVALEEKLSFAEHQIDELNATVFRQQQLIDQLAYELRTLRQQMQATVPAAGGWAPHEEIPPHY